MKLRNYITAGTLLALLALPVGCTSEEVLDLPTTPPDTEVPGENTRQLLFNFSGLKLKSNAPATRAETIATEDETVVESLIIILAGVDSEEAAADATQAAAVVYEYSSNWGGSNPTFTDTYKKLDLVQAGNVLIGKLEVDEAKMLPELVKKRALVLVNGVKIELTGTNGTTVLNSATDLAAGDAQTLYRLCGGHITGAGLDDPTIGISMKLLWGPADLTTENIKCPLPMSAEVANIDFHGSTNLNIQLKRHVSRFDLRNGDTDNLHIGSIQPIDANTGIEVEATAPRVDMMDQSFLPAVPDGNWSNAHHEKVPAFYTNPSALTVAAPQQQPMKFKVTAMKRNLDDTWVKRTYTLKLENEDRQPVSIDANTRYVITIKEVTDLNITGVIEIADWKQGGDVDGDLNTTDKSRKAPAMGDMTDDTAGRTTWTLDGNGVPTRLDFGKLFDTRTMTFTTPKAVAVDANNPLVIDQPEVSVDIFAEAGEANAKVWLEVKKTDGVGTNPDTWTFSVIKTVFDDIKAAAAAIDPDAPGEFPTLWVKVKNKFYPDNSYVMFRVTATDGSLVKINMGEATTPGKNNPLDVGGLDLGTGTANDFEMGTIVEGTNP